MDNCVVCCKSNEDVFSRINTESSEWKEWNMLRVIEKHLWWWYLREPSNIGTVQWICRQCWQELSSFHNFYLKVEREHKHYELLLTAIKCDKDEGSAAIAIKEEIQNIEQESILTENLVHLERPKRGRKKKIIGKFANLDIDELNIAEVKNENEIDDNLEVPKSERKIRRKEGRNRKICDKIASLDIEELNIAEIKSENENNDNLEVSKSEIDINMLATDSMDEWEPFDINHNESDETASEGNVIEASNDDKLNAFCSKKSKTKRQPKTKIVTKCRKKYTKSRKQKETKALKNNGNSNVAEVIKRNDEFIANNSFELSCNICSAPLGDFSNLKVHYRKEHNILGYAMCCNRKFYKRGVFVDHLNVHKDPNYFKCVQCNKPLSTRRSFEKHMETHQLYESRQNLFTCGKCDKSFLKRAVFDRHVLTHVPEDERNFKCSVCEKKFASEYLRRTHISLTHTNKYAKICDICGKLFRDGFSFIRHMGEHNGEAQVKVPCDICGSELTSKYHLNRHKKSMHTEEHQQEQICPYCSKVSPNLKAHRYHVKYTHTLERKHACHMCEKKFRRTLELKEHLSTHTGEPLYTCPHCPRTFISGANMHKHRKLSHRKEWEEAKLKKLSKQHYNTTALESKKLLNNIQTPHNDPTYPEISIM